MVRILDWIKANKLSAALIIVVLYFFSTNLHSPVLNREMALTGFSGAEDASFSSRSSRNVSGILPPSRGGGATPRLDIEDRKVTTNSTMSLVVTDVRATVKSITEYAASNGGYMVNANQTSPEGLANGNIVIRVPSVKLDQTLEFLRTSSVKVVSESIIGRDITDQYMDVEARLGTLEATKTRYETILDKAVDVDEILQVTQQILYIQDQIDGLKGQLAYLDATSKSALITAYLSTDEFELPYAPDKPWRPSVIFKYAVRGLVGNLQQIGSLLISVAVYSVIWIPILVVVLFLKKRAKRPPISKI